MYDSLFRTSNMFNVRVNAWSGNLFPLDDDDEKLNFFLILWIIFVYTVYVIYFVTVAIGSLYFADLSAEETFKNIGPLGVVYFELIFMSVYLNFRRKDLRVLIDRHKRILVDSEDLQDCVNETIGPYKRGYKFYMTVCVSFGGFWASAPVPILLDDRRFNYTDFAAAAYLPPGEPFDRPIFVAGTFLQIIGAMLVSFGKTSIDVYVSHLVLLLSAQYRYVRLMTTKALGRSNGIDDSTIGRSLRQCVQYHCAVIEIGQKLTKIMALYVGSTYLTCILKFCFLAFGFITFESANIEKAAFLGYSCGCLIHIFLICSCIQDLLDESTSVTEDAFHENWHARGTQVKHFFCMMEMSNQIECRLSAWRIVELVRPTLAVILSKSYSVCLLLLKVN